MALPVVVAVATMLAGCGGGGGTTEEASAGLSNSTATTASTAETVGTSGNAGQASSQQASSEQSSSDGSTAAAESNTSVNKAASNTSVDKAASNTSVTETSNATNGSTATKVALSASDPRIVSVLDGDRSPQQHPNSTRLQLSDSQTVSRLNQLSGEAYRHADGSVWFGRERLANGKYAYTARMKRDQALFQGSTQRAEWLAPDSGTANLPYVVRENGTYWFALDYTFEDDVVNNTGTQYGGRAQMGVSGLHGITWGDLPNSSGHSFGTRVYGNQLWMRIHGPGSGPSYVYDVRNNPLSTTVVGNESAGDAHGTARHWIMATLQPGVSVKIVGRVKFASTLAGKPRTEVWRKIGSGPMEKVIDNSEPNTFSTGVRYWKTGIYTWDLGSAWWGNKNTRTMRIRSDLWMRDESASGQPSLSSDFLMNWLER